MNVFYISITTLAWLLLHSHTRPNVTLKANGSPRDAPVSFVKLCESSASQLYINVSILY